MFKLIKLNFTEGIISIMFYRTLQAIAADCLLLFTDQNKQQKHAYLCHKSPL